MNGPEYEEQFKGFVSIWLDGLVPAHEMPALAERLHGYLKTLRRSFPLLSIPGLSAEQKTVVDLWISAFEAQLNSIQMEALYDRTQLEINAVNGRYTPWQAGLDVLPAIPPLRPFEYKCDAEISAILRPAQSRH